MRRAVVVAGAVALVLGLCVASAPPALAKAAPCPGGRFPLTGSPLVPGGAASDAIVIAGRQVSVESGCPVVTARRRAKRKVTILAARWKGCGGLTGSVRLVARIDAATCEALTARFRNRRGNIDRQLSAAIEVPPDAVGTIRDPLPEGAVSVSPEEWEQLRQRPDFHSAGKGQMAADEAAEAVREAADEQMVADFLQANPSFFDQYMGGVDPADASVMAADDGNYDFAFTDASGAPRTVRTHGRRFFRGNVAAALRTFPTQKNQLDLYTDYYDGLASIDPALVGQYPTPAEAGGLALDVLRGFNDNFASLVDQYLPLAPPPGGTPPLGYPASCSAEEGSGDGSDRAGGSTCGTHKALGVYANRSWPLKFFATCVKDQAGRGTCWSFGTIGAIELTMAKKYGRWINLAEQDLIYSVHTLWDPRAYGDGFWPNDALRKMVEAGYTLPFEEQWDYNPSRSRIANNTTRTYRNSCVAYGGDESGYCSDQVGQGRFICVDILWFRFCGFVGPAHASTSGVRPIAYSEVWNSSNTSLSLGTIFWAVGIFRKPVIYSFAVAPSFYPDANGYVAYRGPHCPVTTGADGKPLCTTMPGCECDIGGHAVLITGLVDNTQLPAGAPPGSGGGYLIIKNSWSNCYGDSGYAYLPYDWVKAYGMSAVVLGDVN